MPVAAVAMLIAACNKDTDDLIIGTWKLASVTYQSTGHPDQSLNGRTTETFDGSDKTITMTFNKDGNGRRIESRTIHDSIYVYEPDTTFVGDTFYVTDIIRFDHDTTFVIADTASFTYLATGNLLNIQEAGRHTNYRIDKLDQHALTVTDTNTYTDIYTNNYGRSIQFTQETKTVMSFVR